jgi:hypothetical protein
MNLHLLSEYDRRCFRYSDLSGCPCHLSVVDALQQAGVGRAVDIVATFECSSLTGRRGHEVLFEGVYSFDFVTRFISLCCVSFSVLSLLNSPAADT